MAALIQIKLESNAAEIVGRLHDFPPRMALAIAAAMDRTNEETVGYTVAKHLTGAGPFPVAEHRLGVGRAIGGGRLRNSLRPELAQIAGTTVLSSIGTNVRYAGVHEFGFDGMVSVRKFTRVNRSRDVYRPRKDGKGVTKDVIAAGFSTVRAHTMKMNMPARAPIETGIRERVPQYSSAISAAILAAWEAPQS